MRNINEEFLALKKLYLATYTQEFLNDNIYSFSNKQYSILGIAKSSPLLFQYKETEILTKKKKFKMYTETYDDFKNRVDLIGLIFTETTNIKKLYLKKEKTEEENNKIAMIILFVKAEAYRSIISILQIKAVHIEHLKCYLNHFDDELKKNHTYINKQDFNPEHDPLYTTYLFTQTKLLLNILSKYGTKVIINDVEIDSKKYEDNVNTFIIDKIKHYSDKKIQKKTFLKNNIKILQAKQIKDFLLYKQKWSILQKIRITKYDFQKTLEQSNFTKLVDKIEDSFKNNYLELWKLLSSDTIAIDLDFNNTGKKEFKVLTINNITGTSSINHIDNKKSFFYNFFIGLQKGLKLYLTLETLMNRGKSKKVEVQSKIKNTIEKLQQKKNHLSPKKQKSIEKEINLLNFYLFLVDHNVHNELFILIMISAELGFSKSEAKAMLKLLKFRSIIAFNNNYDIFFEKIYPNYFLLNNL